MRAARPPSSSGPRAQSSINAPAYAETATAATLNAVRCQGFRDLMRNVHCPHALIAPITTPEDAIEFLIDGAAAVGVGTALFYDPLVCRKINAGILSYLDRLGLGAVGELTGTLRLHAPPVRAPQCTC